MSLDFDGAVNDYGWCRHDVVFHHLGDVLDFGKFDIEIVLANHMFHYLIGLLAFGATRTKNEHLADFCSGSCGAASGYSRLSGITGAPARWCGFNILIDDYIAVAAARTFLFGCEKS